MRISDWSSDVCSSDLDPVADVILAGMPSTFEAVDTHRIAADRFGLEGVTDRCAFVDHRDAILLERRQPLLRLTRGLDDLDPTFDDRIDQTGKIEIGSATGRECVCQYG